jgi:hypothetical protein
LKRDSLALMLFFLSVTELPCTPTPPPPTHPPTQNAHTALITQAHAYYKAFEQWPPARWWVYGDEAVDTVILQLNKNAHDLSSVAQAAPTPLVTSATTSDEPLTPTTTAAAEPLTPTTTAELLATADQPSVS